MTNLLKMWIVCIIPTKSFLTSAPLRTLSQLNYNGNDKNKNHLRGIDYKLDRYKKQMKELFEEKKKLIENMTDIRLSISAEEYYRQFMGDPEEDEEEKEDDDDILPRNIDITFRINGNDVGLGSEKKTDGNSETKSENFEVIKDSGYTFKTVGGYDLIKEELMQCADMLVNYEKYAKYNVRTPKGIILEGPPGNGKTLLAKCFSGEINVGFIPVSGAQFQEKYVGVGASRVRELFELATKNVPCIIFIDEIDALCRKRSDDGNARSEHDATLNELLVNMDGFNSKCGIFIMGATNRVDLLDTALTRPGRIDKKIFIGNPDEKTRKAILRIHMKGKPMDKGISMDDLLLMTQGFSGAQIENFLNEAMLYALRDNRKEMTREDLEKTSNRVLTGFQSVETKLTKEHLFQVAIHEMGHAITAILTGHKKVIKVSINLWSPKSLGFTQFEVNENSIMDKESLIGELMVLLGGRVAEEIVFGSKISNGASQDIDQTKKLAEQMVLNWGMGDRIIYPSGSEYYRKILEQEMDELIQLAYRQTKTILDEKVKSMKELAELLVETREIKGDELQRYL
jgi:cell division protease FtsH